MPAGIVLRPNINPRFLPAIDRVLILGAKLGPIGRKQAINKVLQLVPEWKRGDCWRRIRQLRRNSLIPHFESQTAQTQTVQSGEPHAELRARTRPWSADEDAKLLDWAGYEPVSKIAQRLGRSVRAVRFRLGALGMSARVTDGWSQRELRKLLRVSPARLRDVIGVGMLRVGDRRITARSMLVLCSSNGSLPDHRAMERLTTTLSKHAAYSWDRAADLLGIGLEQLQTFICKGKLKVLDPFVTDRSFEEFCRKHSDQINMSLIDSRTAKWLEEEYGVLNGGGRSLSRAQKHALVVRTCKCGRRITGNIFFKHVKHCSVVQEPRLGPTGALYALGKRPLEGQNQSAEV